MLLAHLMFWKHQKNQMLKNLFMLLHHLATEFKKYPTNENAEINPKYPYALTKFLGESLVEHWSKVYKMNFISLRLFNVYGTRSRTTGAYGAVMGVFLNKNYQINL